MSSEATPAPKRRSRSRPTLSDIARQVGVSSMTASRALFQPELVSKDVRIRIEQAAKDLGYVPNRAARELASARSDVIAVLIPSLSNAVFTDVLAGIQTAIDADGYQLLIGNTRYSDAEEEKLLRIHLQSHPAGVLLTGLTQSDSVRRMLEVSQTPTVCMMDLAEDPQRLSVGFSQQAAGHAITRHLLERGYRRIGFIGAQLDERTLKRAEGHRQALREAGLYDAAREVIVPDPSTIGLGAELLQRLLQAAPDCDAVFCCNDDLAYGAIHHCQRQGIEVPARLAICGFNDLPASAWMHPAVTTIATPRYRIGFEAATLLKRVMKGETPEQRHIDVGFTLMARDST